MSMVKPKAGAKGELLLNKPASAAKQQLPRDSCQSSYLVSLASIRLRVVDELPGVLLVDGVVADVDAAVADFRRVLGVLLRRDPDENITSVSRSSDK